jgi:hypothetical protein
MKKRKSCYKELANMCLLIVGKDQFPSEELLRAGEKANMHGAGIAFVDGDKVQWMKGLKVEDLMEFQYITGSPFMIHFRWASVGGVKPELTHPFPVTKNAGTALQGRANMVMAHNGHLSNWQELMIASNLEIPGGPWSDTRAMAFLTAYKGRGFLEMIDEKVGLMTPGGVEIFGKGWIEKEGCQLSNDPTATRSYSTASLMAQYGSYANEYEDVWGDDDGDSWVPASQRRGSRRGMNHYSGESLPRDIQAQVNGYLRHER